MSEERECPRGAVRSVTELKELMGKEVYYTCTCISCSTDKKAGMPIKFKLEIAKHRNDSATIRDCNGRAEIVRFGANAVEFVFENYWDAYAFQLKVRDNLMKGLKP